MGQTTNLQLNTISVSDNMTVREFFQLLAGNDGSNMVILDSKIGELISELGDQGKLISTNEQNIGENTKAISGNLDLINQNVQAIKSNSDALTSHEESLSNIDETIGGHKDRLDQHDLLFNELSKENKDQDDVFITHNERITDVEKAVEDLQKDVVEWDELESIPSEFAPTAHEHSVSDITGSFEASMISGGSFANYVTTSSQPPNEMVLRNSKLLPIGTEITLEDLKEGEIIWFYEVPQEE